MPKQVRRYGDCTRSKLDVFQYPNVGRLLSRSSACDACKHDSNRVIFDVGLKRELLKDLQKLEIFDVLRQAGTHTIFHHSVRSDIM